MLRQIILSRWFSEPECTVWSTVSCLTTILCLFISKQVNTSRIGDHATFYWKPMDRSLGTRRSHRMQTSPTLSITSPLLVSEGHLVSHTLCASSLLTGHWQQSHKFLHYVCFHGLTILMLPSIYSFQSISVCCHGAVVVCEHLVKKTHW